MHWISDRFNWVLLLGVVVLIAGLVIGFAIYYRSHDCHGTGRYHTENNCTLSDEEVICIPQQVEEMSC